MMQPIFQNDRAVMLPRCAESRYLRQVSMLSFPFPSRRHSAAPEEIASFVMMMLCSRGSAARRSLEKVATTRIIGSIESDRQCCMHDDATYLYSADARASASGLTLLASAVNVHDVVKATLYHCQFDSRSEDRKLSGVTHRSDSADRPFPT